jgi:hypothetical protein
MNKILIPVLLLVAGLLAGYLIGTSDVKIPLGSVTVGNEYQYSQYSGTVATTTLLKKGPSALGSIIITEDTAAIIEIYDCATTSESYVASTTYSTLITRLQTAMAEGVYTFDIQANRGIVVSSSLTTLAGDITFTYR